MSHEDPTPNPPATTPAPLGDALAQLFKRLLHRSQGEIERVASSAGSRLELRQMKRDLDHFWVRMGKTAYRLQQAGELDHPALRKAMERIDALEAKIDAAHNRRGRSDDPNPIDAP